MKDTQPNSHSNQTNGIVENKGLKLKNCNFSQETQKLDWQSMPTKLTPKMWYMGTFRINKLIKNRKVNVLT